MANQYLPLTAFQPSLELLSITIFIFSHIEKHSSPLEDYVFLSARVKVVGYVPQVRVDLILENDHIRSLLEELRSAKCSFKGKYFYWVSHVDESGEL